MRPMLLSDLLAEGLALWIWCEACGHHGRALPGDLLQRVGDGAVPDASQHFRCSKCGSRQISTRPDWPRRGRVARALPENEE